MIAYIQRIFTRYAAVAALLYCTAIAVLLLSAIFAVVDIVQRHEPLARGAGALRQVRGTVGHEAEVNVVVLAAYVARHLRVLGTGIA